MRRTETRRENKKTGMDDRCYHGYYGKSGQMRNKIGEKYKELHRKVLRAIKATKER